MTLRLIACVLSLLLVGAATIVSRPPAHGVHGTITKQELQPATLRKDQCYVVVNAGTAADCDATAGNGIILNICCSDGANWLAVGDGTTAGGGDITDVGPGCGTGACWTDGLATAGTILLNWEGTAVDASDFTIIVPANPAAQIDITMPTATATLATLALTETFTNKSISGPQIDSGTIPAARVGADHVDAMSEIVAGIKRGPDATDTHLLTTDVAAPGSLTCLEMDTDGSVVLAAGACGAGGAGDVEAVGPGCATGQCWTDGLVTTGTVLLNWEGTTANANDFTIIVPADPGSQIDITMPVQSTILVGDNTAVLSVDGDGLSINVGTLDVGGGVGITANLNDVAFNALELNDLTWGDNSDATIIWTFDPTGATNPLFRASNNLFSMSADLVIGGTAVLNGARLTLIGTSTRILFLSHEDATNALPVHTIRMTHNTSGVPTDGIGVGIRFDSETTGVGGTANAEMGDLNFVFSTVDHPTRDSQFEIFLVENAAAPALRLRLTETGDLRVESIQDLTGPGTNWSIGADGAADLGGATNFIRIAAGGILTGEGSATIEAEALTGTVAAARVGADHIDAVSEIAAGIKRGPDATDTHLLTTDVAAPGTLTCLEMDTDGSVVLAAGACGAAGAGDINDVGPGCATGACWTDGLVTTGTILLNWEGTTANANDFTIIVPADPAAQIDITMPTATSSLATLALAETFTNKSISGDQIDSGTVPAARVGADHLDAISEIAAGIKRGPDATDTHLLTTDVAAPGSLTCLEMDTDGSVVLAAGACAAGANSFGIIGTATADSGNDTITITDSLSIDLITTNDPEDLSAAWRYDNTQAGNPALLVDQCVAIATVSGGGFICEGSVANDNEQVYLWPDSDGETTEHIVTTVGIASRGSIIRGSASGPWEELIVGISGTHLFSNGTDVAFFDSDNVNFILLTTAVPGSSGGISIDTNGDNLNIIDATLQFQEGTTDHFIPSPRTYPVNQADVLGINTTTNQYVYKFVTGGNAIDVAGNDTTIVISLDLNSIDFPEILYTNTLAGNPALLVDECFLVATATGGGFICEGSTANTNEMLFLFPDEDEADTTRRIVLDSATQTLTNKSISGAQIDSGTIPVARVGADHTDLMSEIAAGIKRGPDATDTHLLTTDVAAPGALTCLEMDTDGSVVLAAGACAAAGAGDVNDVGPGCATGACWTDGLATTGTVLLNWEGTAVDANDFEIIVPANPAAQITITMPVQSTVLVGDTTAVLSVDGDGLAINVGTLDVGGGTCISANLNDVAITANCIDDAQVAANALDNTSLSLTLDLGGATSFEIPNAAAPVVDVLGEIAVDSTDVPATDGLAQLIYHDGGEVAVLTAVKHACFDIADLVAADDDFAVWSPPYAVTIRGAYCYCNGTCTAAGILHFEKNRAGVITQIGGATPTGDVACSNSSAATEALTDLSSGTLTLASFDQLRFDTITTPTATNNMNICWTYTVDRQ